MGINTIFLNFFLETKIVKLFVFVTFVQDRSLRIHCYENLRSRRDICTTLRFFCFRSYITKLFPVLPPMLFQWLVMHTAMYSNLLYLFYMFRIYSLCFLLILVWNVVPRIKYVIILSFCYFSRKLEERFFNMDNIWHTVFNTWLKLFSLGGGITEKVEWMHRVYLMMARNNGRNT
jgi:hypothetical protein